MQVKNTSLMAEDSTDSSVLVIGLGFVGLTFALHAASNGLRVYGLEKDPTVVAAIKGGNAHFREDGINEVLTSHLNKNFHVATVQDGFPGVEFGAVVITVGTPVAAGGHVNMEQLNAAWSTALTSVRDGGLIILRSTVAVGTSRRLAKQAKSSRDVVVAFCPERTVEGAALDELSVLPQLVSQHPAGQEAHDFFSLIATDIVKCTSLEQAEAAKLLCNVYRDLHFSIANIFELACENMNLSPSETFAVAGARYPRFSLPKQGFVGGPCLSKDAFILAGSLSDELIREWVLVGRRVHEKRLKESAAKIKGLLFSSDAAAKGRSVLLCGMAFKGEPATDDLRDSPSVELYNIISGEAGVKTFVHDMEITTNNLKRHFEHVWTEQSSEQQTPISLVVVINTHQYYQCEDSLLLQKLGLNSKVEVMRL